MSGLFDHIGPSIVAQDLTRIVRRLRKHSERHEISMLVVEGPNDETLLAPHCIIGPKQVFAAGTRTLVEQLLVHLRDNPIPDCDCVFLTDCDGLGKSPALKTESALVVTTNCDIEADLVAIGVAESAIAQLTNDSTTAARIVDEAIQMATPVSRVRRAAAKAGVSFKRSGTTRLALRDFDDWMLRQGMLTGTTPAAVINTVSAKLQWSDTERQAVEQQLIQVPHDYRMVCSGKDVLDAAWFLMKEQGLSAGKNAEALQRAVRSHVSLQDLANWEVATRVRAWQSDSGTELLRPAA